jgi:curved DNA-binding protein CbpA
VRRAFAALELPLTATADDVRRAYRRLMDRYHPDRHAGDPEREAVANEVARRLTEAYRLALAFRKTQPV